MKLKEITFVFENCDSVTIDGYHVGHFVADNIVTSVRRLACNYIGKMDTVTTFAIEIHRYANITHYPFGCKEFRRTVFDRLEEYNDIVSVMFTIVDENGKEDKYDCYVDWTGDSEYTNDAQKTYISNAGNMYIVIDKALKIEDMFHLEQINDIDCSNSDFELYHIGDM